MAFAQSNQQSLGEIESISLLCRAFTDHLLTGDGRRQPLPGTRKILLGSSFCYIWNDLDRFGPFELEISGVSHSFLVLQRFCTGFLLRLEALMTPDVNSVPQSFPPHRWHEMLEMLQSSKVIHFHRQRKK